MIWGEIDLDNSVWSISSERTKLRREFRVPITQEMKKIIKWATPMRRGNFVLTLSDNPLSDVAISKQLKRRTSQSNTVHGLRTSFRTWCQETGVEEALAENCLDHAVGNEVRRAYARSDMLEERMRVMTDWAEFLRSPS